MYRQTRWITLTTTTTAAAKISANHSCLLRRCSDNASKHLLLVSRLDIEGTQSALLVSVVKLNAETNTQFSVLDV